MLIGDNKISVGSRIFCRYPVRGKSNISRNVNGVIDKIGRDYIIVKKDDGTYRTLSFSKISFFKLVQ